MIYYDMPESVYHASLHLGQSTLKLAHKSLRLMKDKLDGIYHPAQSPAMVLGGIIHKMILQPDTIKTTDSGPVNSHTGKPYGRDTMAFADWQAEHADFVVVEPWVRIMLDRMPTEIGDIFAAGTHEVSVIRDEIATGLPIKARIDSLDGMATITDLKTCNDCDGSAIDREIRRNLYWFQEAFYRMIMLQETGETHRFQFVFCEKRPPFRWSVVPFTEKYRLFSDEQVLHVLRDVSGAIKTGDWRDNEGMEHVADLPDFMDQDEPEENDNGGIDL
jgi:hypothetical protein